MNRKDFLKAGLVMIGGVLVPKQQGATIIVRGPRVASAAAASFSDNFNRSNETPLAGNWVGTGLSGWTADTYLLSNAASNSGGGNNALARVKTSTATFAGNQYAETTVVAGNDVYCGPAVRIQSDTDGNCYFAFYAGSSTWHIQKGDGTTNAVVGSTISAAGPSTNDVIRLEITGSGDLVLKLNGSTLGSRTDSSSPLSGGQPGFWTGSGLFIDNFAAADL